MEATSRNLKASKIIVKTAMSQDSLGIVAKMTEFHQLLADPTHMSPLMMFNRKLVEWAQKKIKNRIPTEEEPSSSYRSNNEIFQAIKSLM